MYKKKKLLYLPLNLDQGPLLRFVSRFHTEKKQDLLSKIAFSSSKFLKINMVHVEFLIHDKIQYFINYAECQTNHIVEKVSTIPTQNE